ncbi:MAG: DNA/RNA non-specific endonuclease [Bacteroidia bacterium]|nr:DNA/RNA non-specific endonuclease [Bacteroidia bacterium]
MLIRLRPAALAYPPRTGLMLIFALLLAACGPEEIQGPLVPLVEEDFEAAGKRGYEAAVEELVSGPWLLDDALIGSSNQDLKNGSRSVRIRNEGRLRMNFDVDGARVVRVAHAAYGSDDLSEWELWHSTDEGRSWSRTAATVRTGATLRTATIQVSFDEAVRFEIRKVSGGEARLNIDDFYADPLTGGGGVLSGRGNPLDPGNPSDASASSASEDNYLMIKDAYALSYHRDRGTANWVAWHLSVAWKGSAQRQNDFRADPALPADWYAVTTDSYTNTGFDRGHLCPSEDRDSTVGENSATFLMTNIVPQAPDLNQGPWKDLESYCRKLMTEGSELYIYAGVSGRGGSGTKGSKNTLDEGRVTVPKTCWKVILVLPEGNDDLSRISGSSRVIAVEMPNTQSSDNKAWHEYRLSVDELEDRLGYDFFTALPSSLQTQLESRVDNGPVD